MLPAYIDELPYGGPSKQDWHNIQISNYLDDLLPNLERHRPPLNSSEQTKNELIVLLQHTKGRQITRKELFDRYLVPHLDRLFIDNGAQEEDVTTTTQNIVKDVLPIITKLKFHFNRPRPYQIAYYYPDMELYHDHSYFVSSPSYPSGHCVMGLVAGHVLSNHYPQSYGAMQNFMHEVLESRLSMGVHYPSDNEFAQIVGQAIISHPKFQRKYDL